MPKITIENLSGTTIETDAPERTVLKILQENRIDWMHACGAKGRCTTCKAIVTAGNEFLTEVTAAETRFINMGALKPNERLTCQVMIKGDIAIRVPKQYQLPHMQYNDE